MEWRPASIVDVIRIVESQLGKCTQEQAALFEQYRVKPHLAPISRLGKLEQVVVIARKGHQVMYWEDIKEGFGISAVDADGRILERDCNQSDLVRALNAWT
jgi:hypothetical protein